MKKGLTELVIIIDKSGSMNSLKEDVVGGFNSLIEEQKKDEGEVLVSLIAFNDEQYLVYDHEDIKNIKPLEVKNYKPSGCTALLDAIGHAITDIERFHKVLKDDIPEHTIFSIMTDGLENSSYHFTYKMVKELINEYKRKGWEFIFQAANIDANLEGERLGIEKEDIQSFDADSVGVKKCFKKMCGCIQQKKEKKR